MVDGLTLTSEPFVQKRPIDRLDARKAPAAVAGQIREAILGGTYEPGARIREAELAERFKVSRSPVREALPALERRGRSLRSLFAWRSAIRFGSPVSRGRAHGRDPANALRG